MNFLTDEHYHQRHQMKLSLSWIFDHIANQSWQNLNTKELFDKISNTTAEIDYADKVTFNPDEFTLGRYTKQDKDTGIFISPELDKEISAIVTEHSNLQADEWYLLKKEKKTYRLATLKDFNSEKDGSLPSFHVTEDLRSGGWKDNCETEDYIITIDNKSLSHRPDLWGHRGFAREIAAMFDFNLVAEEQIIVPRIIKNYDTSSPGTNGFTLQIQDATMCNRIAGIVLTDVEARASLPHIALRLARIDARPINALVDGTNYVMYDLGQPLHVFDKAKIPSSTLIATHANQDQKLALLDHEEITLNEQDCVISDGTQALSLAGIMGGLGTAVSLSTTEVIVESAHFEPAIIRRSTIRHKKRTESSTRFEKGLDPNQNTTAIMRYLLLMTDWNVPHKAIKEIISIGRPAHETQIAVSDDFIQKKIGMRVPSESVDRLLSKLGFGVQEKNHADGVMFDITVPTFRLRDVAIPEDIVEEVARFIGYDAIPHILPTRPVKPIDHGKATRLSKLKWQCAYGLAMHELASYTLFDEEYLKAIAWEPTFFLELQNPVSEHWRRLRTSLIPHLCKAITINSDTKQPLAFFEWGKVWSYKTEIAEQHKLAGIWYEPESDTDFYQIKDKAQTLFDLFKIPVRWEKATSIPHPWYHPHQTAQLRVNDTIIGHAGMTSPVFFSNVAPGDAFIMEIDGDFLLSYVSEELKMQPVRKYPPVDLDISVMIPKILSVAQVEEAIGTTDPRIRSITLVDYYEKPEWVDQRSITVRYVIQDETKTLTKEEIDAVSAQVSERVGRLGAAVR